MNQKFHLKNNFTIYLFLITIFYSFVRCSLDGQCENLRGEDNCKERTKNFFTENDEWVHNFTNDVLVFTVATEAKDGFLRYLDSASEFNIKPIVLGFGQEWKGGEDLHREPGGGWKINLLKDALIPYKDEKDTIVLFTDGYDVIFTHGLNEIIKRFQKTNARVLFGAESYCWPDPELAPKYPEVKEGKRFLNSGMFIGYIPEILKLLEREPIEDTGDDQLFFTKPYLDEEFRNELQIKLDHKSEIFQNIFGADTDLEVFTTESKEGDPERYYVKNLNTQTEPLILHGNGLPKTTLNYIGNYIPNTWNSKEGCRHCQRRRLNIKYKPASELPIVFIALFIHLNTPFLEQQLEKIHALDYPKERIHLFIHNTAKYHSSHVTNFTEKYGSQYLSVKRITPEDGTAEWRARDLSLDQCLAKNCDLYFSVDSIASLDNPQTLRSLIEQNRTVIGPMLTRPGRAWSNFWGALTKDGFYARSKDYMDIVNNEKRGIWNVPYLANCYLVNATLLKRYDKKQLNFNKLNLDPDMVFCSNLRELDVFMYVSNVLDFGHLINTDTYDITRAQPDMYQIFDNEKDWEERYIHKDYRDIFLPGSEDKQPCPDVYWFPIVSEKFNEDLINMMENYGKWSSGKNEDDRLEGGYEAVPTRDIHMTQVGFDPHWQHFLKVFVLPLVKKVFLGYAHDPPNSLMNFVVRYRPDEQPFLKPHHDTSTYTINIALNQVGVDYEGGGCRFIRYNCSVVDTKPGWILIHPGKLTHYHEGLTVTNGTRYIMVSFVDP